MLPIAHIQNDFNEKFGIPRQSGLAELPSVIVFNPKYRVKEAFRGLEFYSHIWLIWQFSEIPDKKWSPTVRPPKLGGNKRMGVFATRSPFRPNPIGLSAVKLLKIDYEAENAPLIHVSGADLMNNTPIYDIKPYLPYADSFPEASGGFAQQNKSGFLTVDFPETLLNMIPKDRQNGLISALSQDPRPSYQNAPHRIYTFGFGGFQISFTVADNILTVVNVKPDLG
jgi:tRNA-Thr(GGU) m(6)t(6)A37 methyltransferase TsaA